MAKAKAKADKAELIVLLRWSRPFVPPMVHPARAEVVDVDDRAKEIADHKRKLKRIDRILGGGGR